MDAYATINDTWEISQKTGYLLGNLYMGIGKIVGTGYHVDDMQMIQTVELQMMTSWEVTQNNRTNQSHK